MHDTPALRGVREKENVTVVLISLWFVGTYKPPCVKGLAPIEWASSRSQEYNIT
jgi:hypothetical protein